MTVVLGLEESKVTIVFIVVCLTGPVAGVILGGLFVQNVIGGYEKKASMLFITIQISIATLLVFPIYYMNTLNSVGINLWLLMFFGASCIPILQGVTISSLPPNLRASGNSFCNLLIFALGFSCAPYFYGFVYNETKDYDPRLAFMATLSMSGIGLVCSLIACIMRYRRFMDPESQENKNLMKPEAEAMELKAK